MRQHYKHLNRRSALYDCALAVSIGLALAYVLFVYL